MKKKNLISIVTILVAIVAIYAMKEIFKFKPDRWKKEFINLGSSSSPQAADLNGDGIKDIIIGAGDKEFVHTDKAVLAINGKDGSLLWNVGARNQVVGSPLLMDITQDGVQDVFIGGRSALLFCIDGKSGKVLWEFLPDHDTLDVYNDPRVLNFYNPQLIPDVSGDKINDLLVAYGGFIKAKPNEKGRPAGYLMIMDAVTGKVIRKAAMPDNRETYLSPVLYDFNGDGVLEILFGSGGETIDGHFYKISLDSLLRSDLAHATVLDSGFGKGFIAPPVLADVTGDKIPDIVVNAVNGRSMCFNGLTNEKIWEVSLGEGFEIYTTPGPGHFSDDNVPDFFCSFGNGVWPEIKNSVNVAIDGRNGKIIFQDTLGTFQYASPVIIDLTQDGIDDILFAINAPAEQALSNEVFKYLENRITVFDMKNKTTFVFDNPKLGTNLGSTPLLTDLDGDSRLDVVYCYSNDALDVFSFKGMAIERMEISTDVNLVKWGSYMGGANFTSLFTSK